MASLREDIFFSFFIEALKVEWNENILKEMGVFNHFDKEKLHGNGQ
jgi:hypothetical protein